MTSGFWARRRPGLVIAGGLVLLAAITVLLLRAERGPDLVAVLGFPLAVLGTGVALWGLRQQPALSQVARQLADRVRDDSGRALRQALAEDGYPRPADLAHRSPAPETEPQLVGWRDDHGQEP